MTVQIKPNVVQSQNFYQSYQLLTLDIKSLELLLKSYTDERDQIIKKSGPINVRAVAYDIAPGVKIIEADDKILERIQWLSVMISINQSSLEEKKQALKEMKKVIQRMASDLDDKELKVFVAAWFDGKPIMDIATEMYLSIQAVKW